jgi:hypothetical protein
MPRKKKEVAEMPKPKVEEVDELDEWMALLKMNLQQVTQESQKLMEPV